MTPERSGMVLAHEMPPVYGNADHSPVRSPTRIAIGGHGHAASLFATVTGPTSPPPPIPSSSGQGPSSFDFIISA